MSFPINKLSYFRFLWWVIGIGIYLVARFIPVNIVKIILALVFIFGISFWESTYAMPEKMPWVIDKTLQLHHVHVEQINQILENSFKKRNITVRLVILNDCLAINDWLGNFEEDYPEERQNTSLLVINPKTKQSWIILGTVIKPTISLSKCLQDIQEQILMPALANNDIYKASWEGILAISSALEDWPALPVSPDQYITRLVCSVQWLSWFLLIGGGWYYLTRRTYIAPLNGRYIDQFGV